MHIYKKQMDPPSQSSIDALHTNTPTTRSGTMDQMLYILLHQLVLQDPSIQPNTDDLYTTTPTARSNTMHIYRRKMDSPQINQTQMHCTPLHTLLDLANCLYIEGRWVPLSIKHI